MNTEKTLLSIISDLTTDKALQDKVIALYQDHKSNLRHYAWYSEPRKEDGFKRIKSLNQLREEMPYLLTKCYEFLIEMRG